MEQQVYRIRMVHYDDLKYDILIEVYANNSTEALNEANRRAFGTKWWAQTPILKTWGRKHYACKPKYVRSCNC